MRILIILSKLDKTGMTTNTIDLCEGLSQAGHEVILLLSKRSDVDNKRFISRLNNSRVCIKYFVDPVGKNKILSVLQIFKFILTVKADIIHVESPYLTFIPWLLRKKFTSTFHVTDLERCFYYKNANHLIAISKETRDYAIKKFFFKEEDITIVHHGVSTKFAEPFTLNEILIVKKTHNIPEDKFIIGLVGSIEKPRKGHDLLIKAFCNLPDNLKSICHLVFCGSDKNKDQLSKKWLLGLIEDYNIIDKITLIEYCDPLPIYKCFDLAVFPSRLEGFPLTSIEAMMSGVCTMRSDVEGATEQVENGITGYIFRNEDVDQIKEQMMELIINEDKRKQFAKAGQEKALKEFSIAAMTNSTLKVYEKII